MADRATEIYRLIRPYLMRDINDVVGVKKATATQTGVNLNKVLLMDLSIGDYNEFAITESGFSSALSAAGSGDVIVVPPCSISGDHTITDGVAVMGLSRWATVFTGQITGGDGASIENLSITRTANDSSNLIGVVGQSSGTFYVHDCHISIEQSGSGDARGISQAAAGTVEVWSSYVSANSTSGSGYGSYRSAGAILFDGGARLGSTASSIDV